jgi:16S rRNA (guanine1207-N2)-methyltransferase
MTNHYYTDKQLTHEDMFEYKARINEVEFRFYSDSGVFSKTGIDYGSKLLIDSVIADIGEQEIHMALSYLICSCQFSFTCCVFS